MTLGGDQFGELSSQTKMRLRAKRFPGLTVWGRKLRAAMKRFLSALKWSTQAGVTPLVKYFSTE